MGHRSLVLAIAAWGFSAPALATDMYVGPGQTYESIAAAVADAASGDRVLIEPGTYYEPPMVIDGHTVEVLADYSGSTPAGTPVVIRPDAAPISSTAIFHIRGGADVTLRDLDIHGEALYQGILVNSSTLTTSSVSVSDGVAPHGGGLEARNSTVSVYGGSWRANVATDYGGHLSAEDSHVDTDNTSFYDGSAPAGGFASISGGTWLQLYGKVSAPVATDAAVISATNAPTVTLQYVTIENAVASGGAGIAMFGGTLSLLDSTLKASTATTALVDLTSLQAITLSDTRYTDNTATGSLVRIASSYQANVEGNLICGNTTGPRSVEFASTPGTFRNNIVSNNHSDTYGVTARGTATTLDAVNNHFVQNTTDGGGSAMVADGGAHVTAINNLVAWERNPNSAPVWQLNGTMTFTYGLVFDNTPEHLSPDVPSDVETLRDVEPGVTRPEAEVCNVRNLRLSETSPARDAGHPDLIDEDGSRSDIGAFGGEDPNDLLEWLDADGDGYGDTSDCNDADPTVNPAAPEVHCDEVDNDCNEETSDDPDADLDGFRVCDGDCRDNDAAAFPGAEERCNLIDDDCDGTVDNDPQVGLDTWIDGDRDGFGTGTSVRRCSTTPGWSSSPGDCDDVDPSVNPNASDVRDDGIDQDCDGSDLSTLLDGAAGWACASGPTGAGWLALGLLAAVSRRRSAPRR